MDIGFVNVHSAHDGALPDTYVHRNINTAAGQTYAVSLGNLTLFGTYGQLNHIAEQIIAQLDHLDAEEALAEADALPGNAENKALAPTPGGCGPGCGCNE